MTSGLFFLSSTSALAAILALGIDRLFGYPDRLYGAIGHPVTWMGALISLLERWLNAPDTGALANRLRGVCAVVMLLSAVLLATVPLAFMSRAVPGGLLVEGLLAATLLSQRSLREHVTRVAEGLDRGLDEGRSAVAHIVGRDPAALDRSGIVRGALESLAENTSDGVVAPLLWLMVGGLPGIALYKAVNTADSMIGYRNSRYADFGWAAARLDDVVNLPGSRITGVLVALAAGLGDRQAAGRAVSAMRRDARTHVSPNAGWPEAALAGALGIRLGGPRSYAGRLAPVAWMGDGRTELRSADITAGLALYTRCLNMLLALAITWAIVRLALG